MAKYRNSNNLKELRVLVNELERSEKTPTKEQYQTLVDIKSIINNEQRVISDLDKDSKVKRYENVCNTILSLISAVNL